MHEYLLAHGVADPLAQRAARLALGDAQEGYRLATDEQAMARRGVDYLPDSECSFYFFGFQRRRKASPTCRSGRTGCLRSGMSRNARSYWRYWVSREGERFRRPCVRRFAA